MYPVSDTKQMTWYYKYLELIKDGKPISKRVLQALKRVPKYIEKFYFDKERADSYINFIENNIYITGDRVKGEDGLFKMEVEQKFWIEMISFRHEDGSPVVTDLGLILGAGSGKTTFMAALSLAVMMVGSKEENDVIIFSNSISQSNLLFKKIDSTIRSKNSVLYELYKKKYLRPIQKRVTYEPTNSVISVKSYDAEDNDGTEVALAIYDEFHNYKKEDTIENIRKSSLNKKTLSGFLSVFISTNGVTRDMVFDGYMERWINILEGNVEDYSSFPMIYQMDSVQETLNPDLYEKAMPFVRVISNPQVIYEDFIKRKGNIVAQSEKLSKVFNIPQQEYNNLFSTEVIKQALTPMQLRPKYAKIASSINWSSEVYVGYDFASVDDFSSVSILQKCTDFRQDLYKVTNLNFITKNAYANVPENKKELYDKFIKEGSLVILDLEVMDTKYIADYLINILQSNNLIPIKVLGDSFYLEPFKYRMEEEYGADIIQKVRMTVMDLSVPTRMLSTYVLNGRIELSNKLLTWCLNNVRVKEDGAGNIYPNKAKSSEKIDAAISTIMAIKGDLDDYGKDRDIIDWEEEGYEYGII